MKLSADIIFDNLPRTVATSLSGPRDMGLSVGRPELYEGSDTPFRAGHLYVLHANRMPQRAHAEKGSVIACIGDSPRLARYRERCCIIHMDGNVDFYSAFNQIQAVFDRFDAWEDDLNGIIEDVGDISGMLSRSEDVFGNPLYAIDGDFRILGASNMAGRLPSGVVLESEDGGSLHLESFDQFLDLHDLSMDTREPLVLNLLDQTTLNYNLFEADTYKGCVTVHYLNRTYRPSDKPLVEFLGKRLLRAMQSLSASTSDRRGSLRQAVQALIEERPLDAIERDVVQHAADGRRFACMRLKLSGRFDQLPIGYVRNMVESTFARSIVFEYHRNSIVAIIDVQELKGHDYAAAIAESVEPFTATMGMKAGLSDTFSNLLHSRQMFLQADSALDMGMLFAPDQPLYRFQDFALRDMLLNAMGEIPIELRLPQGLRRLIEHDRDAPTSYVETLRVYVENNMSIARTAEQLYVHRSTLLERLQRIRRELDMDLDDPDERLRLWILLKAMQVHTGLQGTNS